MGGKASKLFETSMGVQSVGDVMPFYRGNIVYVRVGCWWG